MAEEYIGSLVRVVLRVPANLRLDGYIVNVCDAKLHLEDVQFLDTNLHLPLYQVHATDINDLVLLSGPKGNPTLGMGSPDHDGVHTYQADPYEDTSVRKKDAEGNTPPHQSLLLADPAIVSISHKSTRKTAAPQGMWQANNPLPPQVSGPHAGQGAGGGLWPEPLVLRTRDADEEKSIGFDEFSGEHKKERHGATTKFDGRRRPHGKLTMPESYGAPPMGQHPVSSGEKENLAPVEHGQPDLEELEDTGVLEQGEPQDGWNGRRPRGCRTRGARRRPKDRSASPAGFASPNDADASPTLYAMKVRAKKKHYMGAGERHLGPKQLPQPMQRLGDVVENNGHSRRHRQRPSLAANDKMTGKFSTNNIYEDGWATEDATDIQGMGDFDFEENLSKFDKQSVFRKIKERDTTASEARLVNFNRRRGHNISMDSGRKNLLHTENVLDPPAIAQDKWNSETGETEAEFSDNHLRRASLALPNAASFQSQQQRHRHDKTSAVVGPADRDTSPTTRSETPSGSGQSLVALPGAGKQGRVSPTGSLTLKATAVARHGLYLAGSKQPCPVVSPVQMLEVERLALVELGLTEDMMTENAARGIAELAYGMLGGGTGRRRSHHYHHSPHDGSSAPFVVVLAGHHLDGVRAIAGARHLRNHGVKVIVYVLGLKQDDAHVSEGMRRQLTILQKSGGQLVYPDGAVAKSLGKLPAPDLIIDALFGITTSYGILERPDQTAAYAFLAWANGAGTNILSVDVPMGIDACTGEPSSINDDAAYMKAAYVVAMGAPKEGLLKAMASGVGAKWRAFVADIGLSNEVWGRSSTRKREGVPFTSGWLLELHYQEAASQ